MSPSFYRFSLVCLVTSAIALSCGPQPGGAPPAGNVETVVAETMQALTPGIPPTVPPGGDLLPHALYYLDHDSAGFLQVNRLDRDGSTVHQITFEPANVDSYAVSPVDGSVAYTSNNQLLLAAPDGSGRRVLVDGGPLGSDESYYTSQVGGVAWSPDGATIAFGFGGLNFYALGSGAVNTALENSIDTAPGFPILREGYRPVAFAPDGEKLLVHIAYYEGGVFALYYLNGAALIRSPEDAVSCCEGSWAGDSSAYYAASPYLGMLIPGLWRLNADGTVDTLLDSDMQSGGELHFAQAPLLAPDGRLYYFYNSLPAFEDFISRLPLYMVRSAADGVTGRANLVTTPFEQVNEILWAPDASFAILAFAPLPEIYQGGRAEMVYPDGRPNAVLVPFARDMRWGP